MKREDTEDFFKNVFDLKGKSAESFKRIKETLRSIFEKLDVRSTDTHVSRFAIVQFFKN